MSTDKHIDKTILGFVCLVIAVTLVFMLIDTTAFTSDAKSMKYESTIFDTSYVHKIDIVMDDWDSFIETCENEEYSYCTVVVDGKQYKNIAIRAKGNTSLSSVSAMDSERYSFKLEFDHYDEGTTLDGLDKLCLNNLIQDNTMMKDYLVYSLMDDMGVDAPLCSYAYITVNGNDWGLYLAVESVEDSFLTRNYGENYGDLYKPDSTGFGGGRGNGKDFNMDTETLEKLRNGNTDADNLQELRDLDTDTDDPEQFEQFKEFMEQQSFPQRENGGMFGGFGGGMGSDDVKLKYTDDDPDSYSNIFDNAKTDVTTQDKNRLISSLKNLSEYTDLENTVDVDEVISYFVVHNFVVNGDSYTGSMIHNYYLYEEEGKLSMIPWDYNLAFGSFQSADASESVNASIDNPVTGGDITDRPMVSWIFSDEEYTEKYHEIFAEFIEKWIENGELNKLIEDTAEMIKPYVESDPTKFCTAEEFENGVTALSEFVTLRGEAVSRQLEGDDTKVDASSLNISDMGTMGRGMGGMGGNGRNFNRNMSDDTADNMPEGMPDNMPDNMPENFPGDMPTPGNADAGSTDTGTSQANSFESGSPEMPFGNMEMAVGRMQESDTVSADIEKYVLLGVSVLILGIGLVIAMKSYK